MPRKIQYSFGRNGQIHGVSHNLFWQVSVDLVDLDTLPNVDSLYIRKSLIFGYGFIDLLIKFYASPEI